MDVGEWLRNLDLGQYEAAFRENNIDGAVLPQLTAEDLKDIGVVIVGDRRKMLTAIAELSASSAAPAPVARPATPAPAPSATDAERRQLTVMFCDLVGSTAMSARLDPEDMREIVGAYHRCCATRIERDGGFVAKYMGDGVLAYFGYPQAHEHDAERAVQAGLAIVEAAPKLATAAGSPLRVRIGIATGLVVVGDLIGSGESRERGIVGETPNLAARLQAIAEPGAVVIAESTRKLLGNLFELRDLGARELKGIAGPARAWAALRPSSAESRFEALHATGLTDLVGREDEFELLLRRWSRAKGGEGQVVLVSGEAGIGKSRLTAALLERLAGEPHTRLRYFCSPQHTDSALHPIIGQIERAAGLARDDPPRAKLDKLDAILAPTSTSIEHAALFAEMLSLPNDGRYPALDLDPPRRRERTFEALFSQVEALTRQSPVLMIVEDAHWADATSLEAFGRTVDRIAGLRALLIVTFRPEFEAPWIGRPRVTALAINRLAPREIDALIDRVAGNKLLPANFRQDIIERTDGIPLFVEEMTKAVLEAEDEGEARRTAAAIPSPALSVPPSLHASLMARLDRLGPAKELAQIGAAIGREFSHALLVAVARRPEAELESALDRLVVAGLLFRQGAPPHSTYLFKHALVQDAAYGTLLREPRRALHARIAEAIEAQYSDVAENRPELLARHYAEAGSIEKSLNLASKAAQLAYAKSAFVEADALLYWALALVAKSSTTPALRQHEIRLQVARLNPLIQIYGYSAKETTEAVERARHLIEVAEARREPPDDPLLFYSVLYGFWVASFMAIDGKMMLRLSAEFLDLAERQPSNVPLVVGNRITGTSNLFTGNLAKGRIYFDRAIGVCRPEDHVRLATLFGGVDPRVSIITWRSVNLWLLGYPDAAMSDAASVIQLSRDLGQAADLMFALTVAGATQIFCGSYPTAKADADELVAVANERNAMFRRASGIMWQGWLLLLAGKTSEAILVMTQGLAAYQSTGASAWVPLYRTNLALANARLADHDRAQIYIAEALAAVKETGEVWNEAEIRRTAGEIELLSPERDAAKAQVHFERALEIARAQQAKSWELRAAMSLARLWRKQGKREQARDLLAPVHGWFTEGLDTLDLKEAKALLDVLAS